MRKILALTMLGACWAGLAGNAQVLARSLPADMVAVIKMSQSDKDWTYYTKKFGELRFDAATVNRIKAVENKLAANEYGNPHSRHHLTNVRIWDDKVQMLVFRNDFGDTVQIDLDNKSPDSGCYLTFSGNGFSRCSE